METIEVVVNISSGVVDSYTTTGPVRIIVRDYDVGDTPEESLKIDEAGQYYDEYEP